VSERRQYCTFFLDDLFLGVEVHHVQEILRRQELTRVPLVPPVIGGLLNLRGQIVTAIELRDRLGLPSRSVEKSPVHVVMRTAEGTFILLVDEVGDVLELPSDTMEEPPRNTAPAIHRLTRGVHMLKDRLLLVLDVMKVLELPHVEATVGGRAP
jgi:purine-binding chemotaxis protein CheW